MNTIGKRIKFLLRTSNRNQKQLSQETGIPQSTLSDIIKGKKEPSVSKIRHIARYLNVDMHWLITGELFAERPGSSVKVAEASGEATYAAANTLKKYSGDTTDQDEKDSRKKYIKEIMNILEILDEDERKFILEMAERLKHKKDK